MGWVCIVLWHLRPNLLHEYKKVIWNVVFDNESVHTLSVLVKFFILVLVLRPLVYTVSALLPAAYIIGLTFTLKTHSHIYDVHVGEGQGMCFLLQNQSQHPLRVTLLQLFNTSLFVQSQGTMEQWSTGQGGGPYSSWLWPRCSPLLVLIWSQRTFSLFLTSPKSRRSAHDSEHARIALSLLFPGKTPTFVFGFLQYFIGVTVLAMVPEIPEIVNGIQFALYNNISLR